MIHVYDKKEKSFDKNGLAVLNEAVECKIIEKLNNEYELILSYPLHSKKYNAPHCQDNFSAFLS
jgi:phage-related protein